MSRLLTVRVLVTVLVVVLWAWALASLGHTGVKPFALEGVADSQTIGRVLPASDAGPLPPGVVEGDRVDQARWTIGERIATYTIVVPAGEAMRLPLQRGAGVEDVVVHAVPGNPLPYASFYWTAWSVLTLLGLVLLWRGRDPVAWGLALFALGFGLTPVLRFVPFPAPWGGWRTLFVEGLLTQVSLVGLYIASRYLVRDGLSARFVRATLWATVAIIALRVFGRAYRFFVWAFAARIEEGVQTATNYLYFAAYAISALVLVVGYRHAEGVVRLRVRWILVATVMLMIGRSIVLWPDPPMLMQMLPAMIIVLTAATYTYVVLRHQLVEVSFVVNRTLVYGSVLALVVGVFAIIEHFIATKAMGEQAGLALHLLVPLVLGVTLHKLRERIEHLVERLFFRRRFAAEQALLRLAHESAYMENADRLIARTLHDVSAHIGPTGVALYRRVDDGYACVGQVGGTTWPERIDGDDPAFVALRAHPNEQDLAGCASAVGARGLAFPMSVAGRLQGALVCGERPGQYAPDERQTRFASRTTWAWPCSRSAHARTNACSTD